MILTFNYLGINNFWIQLCISVFFYLQNYQKGPKNIIKKNREPF